MPNAQKIAKVEDLAKKLESAKSAALFQYQGLDADAIYQLRLKTKQKGGVMEVVKNSLISRALEKINIQLPKELTGPTAITFANEDEIAPFKEIEALNTSKEFIVFKYGIYDKKLLLVEELKKFLSLPSKTALISQFIGGLLNPLQRLVYALRYNQTRLALVLKAISEKQQNSS
jgi:large subunit ribosomal protein L10